MSQKTLVVARLLEKIPPRWQPPEPLAGVPLLEQGLLCVLARRMPQQDAAKAIGALKLAWPDWNEMRVCQPDELAASLGKYERREAVQIAKDVIAYLQEIFLKNHGFNLEFMREDPIEAGKFVATLTFVGVSAGHYLMWLAANSALPISPGLVRVLDRLGLADRANIKKARAAIEPLVPKDRGLDFALRFGDVIDRWCHQKPLCHECVLVDDCTFGKKNYRDWKLSQARHEAQKKKEDARNEILREKESARRARELEREARRREAEQKRVEGEQKKKQRELEKQRFELQRQKAAEARAKLAAEAQKKKELEAKRKTEAEKRKAEQAAHKLAKQAADEAKKKAALESKAKAEALKKAESAKRAAAAKQAQALKQAAALKAKLAKKQTPKKANKAAPKKKR